jgi:hypothetical protein
VPGEIGTAHNLPRDILRGILGPSSAVLNATMRTGFAVLVGHQVVGGGFEIGLAEISFYDGRTELSVITDDEIISRSAQSRASNSGASTQLPTLLILKSKHKR